MLIAAILRRRVKLSYSGIAVIELPSYCCLDKISFMLLSIDLTSQDIHISNSSIQALL
jgi:hypothetical protein